MTKKEYIAQEPVRAKRIRIIELKELLAASDYMAIKYAEGLISEENYAIMKARRMAYRAEINSLEEELIQT